MSSVPRIHGGYLMSRSTLPLLSFTLAIALAANANAAVPAAAIDDPAGDPSSPGPTAVELPIGQPPEYRFEWGSLGGYGFRSEQPAMRFLTDIEGRLALPQFGLLDVAFEGTYGRFDRKSRGTVGAFLKLPAFRCGF